MIQNKYNLFKDLANSLEPGKKETFYVRLYDYSAYARVQPYNDRYIEGVDNDYKIIGEITFNLDDVIRLHKSEIHPKGKKFKINAEFTHLSGKKRGYPYRSQNVLIPSNVSLRFDYYDKGEKPNESLDTSIFLYNNDYDKETHDDTYDNYESKLKKRDYGDPGLFRHVQLVRTTQQWLETGMSKMSNAASSIGSFLGRKTEGGKTKKSKKSKKTKKTKKSRN